MRKIALILISLVSASPAAAQHHHHRTVCQRIAYQQHKVTKRHGHRAFGRDICTRGVYDRHRRVGHRVRQPSRRELWNYFRQLRTLGRPAPPFLWARAGHPRWGAAGVYTLHYHTKGYLSSCIVRSESHGDPNATNGKYGGIAQWDPNAWASQGGLRYARHPQDATLDEQLLILSYGLVHFGCRPWCPFDGC